MGTYQWQNFYESFPSDGTQPLVQTSLGFYTIPIGSKLRRTIFKCQLSCQLYSAVSTGLPLDFSPDVIVAAGLWLNDAAADPGFGPRVLDQADSLSWVFWDTFSSRVDTDELHDTGLWRVTWETPPQGLDLQTRRDAVVGNVNKLYLGWQDNDPNSVINGSGVGWHAYLCGWISVRYLIYTP